MKSIKKISVLFGKVFCIISTILFVLVLIAILIEDFNQKNLEEPKEFKRRDIVISYKDRNIELSKVLTTEIYAFEKGERTYKGLYLYIEGSLGLDFEEKLKEDEEYVYYLGCNKVILIDNTDHYNYLSTKQVRSFRNTHPIGVYFERTL
jgi:hypothetical protein